MTRKRILILFILTALAAVGVAARLRSAADAPQYRFAEVTKGDVQKSVSATGSLTAVTTVSVGTQVSGQISALFVDFNDEVKKGQLLARIDPRLAQQAVTDAEASLERARAQLTATQREHARNRELLSAGLVARSAFDTTESAYAIAASGVKSAQVAVDRARQNLAYTDILAPIDGVVVERNVDLGQTVAASLSAPQLFLIANDLAKMEILVKVDESDIGSIRQGQPVTFTVQALPRETFRGTVKQVRLQSATQENVVSYTVVVAVDNRDGKLLPGMTASTDFLVQSADDVLTVSNAALRFTPPADAKAPAQNAEVGRSDAARTGATGTRRQRANGVARGQRGRLFYLDDSGKIATLRVETGISDGKVTQISGSGLREGMKVITGVTNGSDTPATASSGPFGGNQQQPRRPGGF